MNLSKADDSAPISFQPREPDEISTKLKEADIKAESSMAAAVE